MVLCRNVIIWAPLKKFLNIILFPYSYKTEECVTNVSHCTSCQANSMYLSFIGPLRLKFIFMLFRVHSQFLQKGYSH